MLILEAFSGCSTSHFAGLKAHDARLGTLEPRLIRCASQGSIIFLSNQNVSVYFGSRNTLAWCLTTYTLCTSENTMSMT